MRCSVTESARAEARAVKACYGRVRSYDTCDTTHSRREGKLELVLVHMPACGHREAEPGGHGPPRPDMRIATIRIRCSALSGDSVHTERDRGVLPIRCPRCARIGARPPQAPAAPRPRPSPPSGSGSVGPRPASKNANGHALSAAEAPCSVYCMYVPPMARESVRCAARGLCEGRAFSHELITVDGGQGPTARSRQRQTCAFLRHYRA